MTGTHASLCAGGTCWFQTNRPTHHRPCKMCVPQHNYVWNCYLWLIQGRIETCTDTCLHTKQKTTRTTQITALMTHTVCSYWMLTPGAILAFTLALYSNLNIPDVKSWVESREKSSYIPCTVYTGYLDNYVSILR